MPNSRWLLLQATITLMVSSVRLRLNGQPPADLLMPPADPHRRLRTPAHHLPVPDEANWATWQRGITSRAFTAAVTGYKGQLAGSHFGRDIAPKMPYSRWLLLQATITLMVSSVRLRLNRQPPADLLMPPADRHRRLRTPAHHLPVPHEPNWATWQRGITSRAFTAAVTEYKGQLAGSHFRHNIAPKMPNSRWLLLQVSHRKSAHCFRSSNYSLLAVSCPPQYIDKLRFLMAVFTRKSRSLSAVLLLLSGDIESNPGPMTKAEADSLALALDAIRNLEEGQASLIADLKSARQKQAESDNKTKLLSGKIVSLEKAMALNPQSKAGADSAAVRIVSEQVAIIKARCNDSENRLRRSNLLFFGLDDKAREDWAMSEQKIIDFCADKLGIQINDKQFERVHWLGKYSEDKRRPIIAKLALFKDKDRILSSVYKLKGTSFSIREDFSPETRRPRQKLIEFAKSQNKPFRLSMEKLRIDSRIYTYDGSASAVVPLNS